MKRNSFPMHHSMNSESGTRTGDAAVLVRGSTREANQLRSVPASRRRTLPPGGWQRFLIAGPPASKTSFARYQHPKGGHGRGGDGSVSSAPPEPFSAGFGAIRAS